MKQLKLSTIEIELDKDNKMKLLNFEVISPEQFNKVIRKWATSADKRYSELSCRTLYKPMPYDYLMAELEKEKE